MESRAKKPGAVFTPNPRQATVGQRWAVETAVNSLKTARASSASSEILAMVDEVIEKLERLQTALSPTPDVPQAGPNPMDCSGPIMRERRLLAGNHVAKNQHRGSVRPATR